MLTDTFVIYSLFSLALGTNQRISIVHISDTHNLHHTIDLPSGDILIHTGDFTNDGLLTEFESFNQWLGDIKHKFQEIFVIYGNHEWSHQEKEGSETNLRLMRRNDKKYLQSLVSNGTLLHNESVMFKGLNIWGSAWNPMHATSCPVDLHPEERDSIRHADGTEEALRYENAFRKLGLPTHTQDGNRIEEFSCIPEGVDILLTHGPPAGIFDFSKHPRHARKSRWGGSEFLRAKIEQIKPKVHLFGHLHEQRGFWLKHGGEYIGGVEYAFHDGVRNDVLSKPPLNYPCQLISCNAMTFAAHIDGSYDPDTPKELLRTPHLNGKPRVIYATRSEGEWTFDVESDSMRPNKARRLVQ